jgi:hypothetical protein
MNIRNAFKLPNATRFHYTPRYYKGVEGENSYKIKSKYNKEDIATNFNDYRAHWNDERKLMRTRGNYLINKRLLIIISILILIFLYLIDFDLSIFKLHFQK